MRTIRPIKFSNVWELRKVDGIYVCRAGPNSLDSTVYVQILKAGAIVNTRGFGTKELAMEWAELERQTIERSDSAK